MTNVCGGCKRPMSSHDDHASCPQCRIAVDVHDPCSICGGWTSKQWSKLRRSLVDARARASQRGRQHCMDSAFPQLEAWIMSRPALSASSSVPASEISSQVSGDDFSEMLMVSTSSPLAQQDLVVQTQNGVNMASCTATMAPSTATTAPSTAPAMLLTAGPSTIEPIVPIVAPLGAQGTPSVIQRARPVVSTEQTMQSAVYGTLPYTAPLPYAAYTAPLPYAAMSARPSFPMGYYGQGNQFPLMHKQNCRIGCLRESRCYNISSFRNGSSLKLGELAKPSLSPPTSSPGLLIKVGDDVEVISGRSASAKRARPEDQATDKAKHARSTSPLPRGTTLGGLAQPQGHLRPVLNGLSTDLLLPRTLKPLNLT